MREACIEIFDGRAAQPWPPPLDPRAHGSEQEDMLIAVMDEEELREPAEARGWDLAPNVMWLLEQAFAVHPSVSISVAIERVDISLYKETVDGDSTAYGPVDQETAERVAEDLREVLGDRSVCP